MKLYINIFKRKKKSETYMGKYLNSRKLGQVARKAVYISRENHEAVKRIVGMAGRHGITISGYMDNIITKHLERHGTELGSLKSRRIVEQITTSIW